MSRAENTSCKTQSGTQAVTALKFAVPRSRAGIFRAPLAMHTKTPDKRALDGGHPACFWSHGGGWPLGTILGAKLLHNIGVPPPTALAVEGSRRAFLRSAKMAFEVRHVAVRPLWAMHPGCLVGVLLQGWSPPLPSPGAAWKGLLVLLPAPNPASEVGAAK